MSTRIIHFSDSHFGAIFDSPRALFDKRIFGIANSILFRGKRYSPDVTVRAIELIVKEKPDLAVFTGDAVSSGSPAEFSRALDQFRPIAESGIPFLYVPGNHDLYVKDHACRKAFEEFYKTVTGKTYSDSPYVLSLPEIRVMVIHCARPVNPVLSCGWLIPETEAAVCAEAEKNDSRPLILAGHFPLLKSQGRIADWRRALRGRSPLADLLKAGKIALSLCGHIHTPDDNLNDRGCGEIIAGSVSKRKTMAEIVWEPQTKGFRETRINL